MVHVHFAMMPPGDRATYSVQQIEYLSRGVSNDVDENEGECIIRAQSTNQIQG